MKALVGCEFSGTVRDALIRKGVDAISCDLLPTTAPGPHIQADLLTVLERESFDLLIAHPPCTYLSSSGLHWNKRRPGREQLTEDAVAFVRAILNANVPRIAVENPIGRLSTAIRKPDQIIQPWQFGHDASKATCFWLKNLPPLEPTTSLQRPAWIPCPDGCDDFLCQRHNTHTADCECPPIDDWLPDDDPYRKHYGNQTPSGQNKLGPSADRWALRSITYPGIAEAIAAQWTNLPPIQPAQGQLSLLEPA